MLEGSVEWRTKGERVPLRFVPCVCVCVSASIVVPFFNKTNQKKKKKNSLLRIEIIPKRRNTRSNVGGGQAG